MTMKQLIKSLCTVALLSCSITTSAQFFSESGIYYIRTSDSTVSVTDSPEKYRGDVRIYSTARYEGKTYLVTEIGESAFSGCSNLSSISIPKSVTSIESSAFKGCSKLSSISIPEGVTSIRSNAFYKCINLSSISIPESVTAIEDHAFSYCSSLFKVINYSNLSISKGSSNYGYVGLYAKVVLDGNSLTTLGDFQFFTSEGKHNPLLKIYLLDLNRCHQVYTFPCFVIQEIHEIHSYS